MTLNLCFRWHMVNRHHTKERNVMCEKIFREFHVKHLIIQAQECFWGIINTSFRHKNIFLMTIFAADIILYTTLCAALATINQSINFISPGTALYKTWPWVKKNKKNTSPQCKSNYRKPLPAQTLQPKNYLKMINELQKDNYIHICLFQYILCALPLIHQWRLIIDNGSRKTVGGSCLCSAHQAVSR